MNGFPTRFGWSFKIFSKVVDKEGTFRFGFCCLKRFLVNVWVRFSTSRLVGIDPMLKERKEIVCGFEVLDMGSACVGNKRKGVVGGELVNQSDSVRQRIENVAERLS